MDAISYTQARKNFTATMNQVCEDHAPVIITRQNEKSIVMLSLEDYNAIEETLYLFRSPNNAQRLSKALDDIKNQRYAEKSLIDI